MWARFGFVLSAVLTLASCGNGGGGSASPSQVNQDSPSSNNVELENISLSVSFPISGSLATSDSLSFSGEVLGFSSNQNTEIRIQTPSGVFVTPAGTASWAIPDVEITADSAGEYQVGIYSGGQLLDSQIIRLTHSSAFQPFAIADALTVNAAGTIVYVVEGEWIIQVDLTSGERVPLMLLPERLSGQVSEIVLSPNSEVINILDTAGGFHRAVRSGADWVWSYGLSDFRAGSLASSLTGDIYVYDQDAHALRQYDQAMGFTSEWLLDGDLPSIDKLAYLSANSLVSFGENSLTLFDLLDSSADQLALDSLDLNNVDNMVVDQSRSQLYLRSASTNELWNVDLDMSDAGFGATLLDLGGVTTYALAFSDSLDKLLFGSPNRLHSLDPESYNRETVSELGWAEGERWTSPSSLALSPDGRYAYVSDLADDDIYQVDMESGSRSALNTSGESMEAVSGMVQGGENLYSVDWAKKSVLMTDVNSGLTSDLVIGSVDQPNFSELIAIDLDDSQFRAFVLDRGQRAIYEVSTASGNTNLLLDSQDAEALQLASDLQFDESKQTIYWSSWVDNGLHKLNLNSLQNERVSGGSQGGGDSLGRPNAIALDSKNGIAYIADAISRRILTVDLETGERTVVFEPDFSVQPKSIAFDEARGTLNILDAGTGGLYSLHPESGSLTLISM